MAYDNRLETWWAGMPAEIRSVFNPLYEKADELLKAVAGDPADLMRAGAVYAALGPQLSGIGTAIKNDAGALSAGWHGDAYDQFKAKVDRLEQVTKSTGDATTQTQEILTAAAQAAVDGANTIVDIVVMVIEFALGTLAIAAATAIISLGTSMAAWVAAQLAEGAAALARVLSIVAKVAQVLEKVAEILTKISKILKTIAEIFMDWAKFVKGLTLLPKTFDSAGLGLYAQERIMKLLIGKIDNVVGVPTLPSGITHGLPDVVGDVGGLANDVDAAQAAAK
ncbi:MAG: WXG100 family type VII secretion target [Actinomycetota bacterium]|nr:WXG100 family type VII secretion target [Actinomycetota bacterium]